MKLRLILGLRLHEREGTLARNLLVLLTILRLQWLLLPRIGRLENDVVLKVRLLVASGLLRCGL